MTTELKITPSRVREYISCPLKFARLYGPPEDYEYIGTSTFDPPPESSNNTHTANRSLGSTLHAVLDTLHRPSATEMVGLNQPYPTESQVAALHTLSDDDIHQLVSEHWHAEGYADSQSEDAAFLSACQILRYYIRSPHTPKGQVLATEAYLSSVTTVRGCRLTLSCRADRLELHPDGVLEVLDYKISKSLDIPSPQALSQDLGSYIYWLLALHSYKSDPRVRNVRISQLNLLTLARTEVEYDQHQIIRHKDALCELVASVVAGGLEPRPNAGCAWCPVRGTCPAWREMDLEEITRYGAQSSGTADLSD